MSEPESQADKELKKKRKAELALKTHGGVIIFKNGEKTVRGERYDKPIIVLPAPRPKEPIGKIISTEKRLGKYIWGDEKQLKGKNGHEKYLFNGHVRDVIVESWDEAD